jgi:hypothetical protein
MFRSVCLELHDPGDRGFDRAISSEGLCGREATHLVRSPIDGTWGPHCNRCQRFYSREYVRPMTQDMDDRVYILQLESKQEGLGASLLARKSAEAERKADDR